MSEATLYKTHDAVDWDEVIRGARTLDIIVHYYARWVNEHESAFEEFFGKGGQVRLIVADPEDRTTNDTVRNGFFPNLSVDEFRTKVEETVGALNRVCGKAANGSLQIFYFPQALHYAAVIKDGNTLYLSAYEQFRQERIGSSVFCVDLSNNADLALYWQKTLETFIERSRT